VKAQQASVPAPSHLILGVLDRPEVELAALARRIGMQIECMRQNE
jgi:hypothetical protein